MINEKEFCLVKLKIVSDHCVIICVWGGWVLCSKCVFCNEYHMYNYVSNFCYFRILYYLPAAMPWHLGKNEQ